MPTTAKKALTYPDSNGHTRLWEHLQQLALDTDRELDKISPNSPPVWDSAALAWKNGDGVSLAVGNGASGYRWRKVGRHVTFGFFLQRGSTTNTGTSHYMIDLPVPARDYRGWVGSGLVVATATEPLALQLINGSTLVLVRPNGTRLGYNSFTWAANHTWQGTITYESNG